MAVARLQRGPILNRRAVLAWLAASAMLAGALLLGTLVTRLPVLATVPAAMVGTVLIVRSAEFRLVFVVMGGLLLLQSSGQLGPMKLAYLAGCLVAVGVIIAQRGIGALTNELSPLWLVSIPWLVVCAISLAVARASGTSFQGWSRDIIPYLLFAIHPLFVSDLIHVRRTSFIAPFSLAVGGLAVISTSIQWTQNRGFVALPFNRFLLSSYMLSIVALCLTLAFARYGGEKRLAWSLFAGMILFLLFLTGTRSSIIVLAAPLIIFAIGPDRGLRRFTRGFGALVGMVALFAVIYAVSVTTLNIDMGSLLSRYATIADVTNSSTSAGQSYGLRLSQTDAARRALTASPIFGVGPGYQFTALSSLGKMTSTTNLDSPLAVAAKFGSLGVAASILSLVGYWLFLRRIERKRQTCSGVALRGVLVVLVLTCLLASPFEDKGLSFGLILITTLVARGYGAVNVCKSSSPKESARADGISERAFARLPS